MDIAKDSGTKTEPKPIRTEISNAERARAKFEQLVQRYYHQLTVGCKQPQCDHKLCASCRTGPRLHHDAAALMSIQLASRPKHYFCPRLPDRIEALDQDTSQLFEHKSQRPHSASNKEVRPFLYSLLDSTPFKSLFHNSKAETSPAGHSSNTRQHRRSQSADVLSLAQTPERQASNSRCSSTEGTLNLPFTPVEASTINNVIDRTASLSISRTLTSTQPVANKSSLPRHLSNIRTKSSMDLPSMISGNMGPKDLVAVSADMSSLQTAKNLVTSNGPELEIPDRRFNVSFDVISDGYEAIDDDDDTSTGISVDRESLDAIDESNRENANVQNLSDLESLIQTQDKDIVVSTLRSIFSSPKALNRLFTLPPRLDRGVISAFLETIERIYRTCFQGHLLSKDFVTLTMTDSLEIWLAKTELGLKRLREDAVSGLIAVLENPLLKDKHFHDSILRRFCGILSRLPRLVKSKLVSALSLYQPQRFSKVVGIFQQYLDDHFYQSPGQRPERSIVDAIKMLSFLYHANEMSKPKLVSIDMFYNMTIGRKLNFKEEYKVWVKSLQTRPVAIFSYFNYPFLFDPISKTRILHIDAMVQMSLEFEDAFVNQALIVHAQKFLHDSQAATDLETEMKPRTNPYLLLEIRRECLVEDTLSQLQKRAADLKKPLRVKFIGGGEEGMDQGGVQKEFFQILVNHLLDPQYDMFTYDTETRYVWINGHSLESERHFELVGTVIGLALYNGVILGIQFPQLLYKKLLDEHVTLDDVKDAFPQLGRGLQTLLDWQDGDVADVFLRTFVIEYDVHGSVKSFPLCDGGADVLVTNENRHEYVYLYINHLVHDSTRRQFAAFKRGFWKVCGGKALKMCRAEELELLVCGSTEFDFIELEKGAQYDDGYSTTHQLIVHLWSIIHEMTQEQKKKLLMFVTASDRIPLKGLGNVTFVVQRNGPDTDRLPTALTCFGRLLLPEYSGREKLREKLLTAIENAKGFGLV